MPQIEKAIHLDAFKLYMEMGGMSPAFLTAFASEFGKSDSSAFRWAKDFDWKTRIKEPIDEAVEELKKAGKLDAKELLVGFLDLCKNRMDGISTQKGYVDAIFGTAFSRIPTEEKPEPENALEVKSLQDMESLVRMHSMLEKGEQTWVKLGLVLVGEPDSRSEEKIIFINDTPRPDDGKS